MQDRLHHKTAFFTDAGHADSGKDVIPGGRGYDPPAGGGGVPRCSSFGEGFRRLHGGSIQEVPD